MNAARASALWLCLALAGCATTSGQDWLNSPIEPQQANSIYVSTESSAQSRPRLQHTVTLGESYASSAEAPGPAASNGTGVHVNVATYVPVTVNNYGAYAVDFDPNVAPPARATPSSSLQPGQDFPAPPSYGPAFPYSTSPASPWKR